MKLLESILAATVLYVLKRIPAVSGLQQSLFVGIIGMALLGPKWSANICTMLQNVFSASAQLIILLHRM